MVDMTDSKSVAGDCVRVQVSSPVRKLPSSRELFLCLNPFLYYATTELGSGINLRPSCFNGKS